MEREEGRTEGGLVPIREGEADLVGVLEAGAGVCSLPATLVLVGSPWREQVRWIPRQLAAASTSTFKRAEEVVEEPWVSRERREEREAEEKGRERAGEGEVRRREAREGERRARSLLLVYSLCPSLDTSWQSWSSLAQASRVRDSRESWSLAEYCSL